MSASSENIDAKCRIALSSDAADARRCLDHDCAPSLRASDPADSSDRCDKQRAEAIVRWCRRYFCIGKRVTCDIDISMAGEVAHCQSISRAAADRACFSIRFQRNVCDILDGNRFRTRGQISGRTCGSFFFELAAVSLDRHQSIHRRSPTAGRILLRRVRPGGKQKWPALFTDGMKAE
jgi:hypothetical protein